MDGEQAFALALKLRILDSSDTVIFFLLIFRSLNVYVLASLGLLKNINLCVIICKISIFL